MNPLRNFVRSDFPKFFGGGDFCPFRQTDSGRFTILTNHIDDLKVFKVVKVIKDTKNLFTMEKLCLLPYLASLVRAIALSTERGFAASLEDPVTDPEIGW